MTLEQLYSTSIQEIERILSTKTVVGEPVTVDGRTLIPLLSIGFGFGVGEGTGGNHGEAQGTGGGLGGGGGVRPIAVIVVDKDGVRVETVAPKSSTLERVAGTLVGRQRGEGKPEASARAEAPRAP